MADPGLAQGGRIVVHGVPLQALLGRGGDVRAIVERRLVGQRPDDGGESVQAVLDGALTHGGGEQRVQVATFRIDGGKVALAQNVAAYTVFAYLAAEADGSLDKLLGAAA